MRENILKKRQVKVFTTQRNLAVKSPGQDGSILSIKKLDSKQANKDIWIFCAKYLSILCLVLLQVPKCFGLVQIFCARQKIYLHIVPDKKMICIQ